MPFSNGTVNFPCSPNNYAVPSVPFDPVGVQPQLTGNTLGGWALFITGMLKMFNCGVCATLWPGGIIWPMYSAGMLVGGAFAVMCDADYR